MGNLLHLLTVCCSLLCSLFLLTAVSGEPKTVMLGASLSSDRHQFQFKLAVEALNTRMNKENSSLKGVMQFNATSILMDGNPIRSALDVCDRLLTERVYTVVASHPNSSLHAPISVSYTCGYYQIPVIGVSARDSAFSDMVSLILGPVVQIWGDSSVLGPESWIDSCLKSYTCGYYQIPVIGVSARDSAFSDMVSLVLGPVVQRWDSCLLLLLLL